MSADGDDVDLGAGILADGHHPANGLADVDVPASVEVVALDGRHLTIWLETRDEGSIPREWVSLVGRAADGDRVFWTQLDKLDTGRWHASYSFDSQPLDVEEVRLRECEDCGATDRVVETSIDGLQQHLCADCREKWGNYLSSTFRGGRS